MPKRLLSSLASISWCIGAAAVGQCDKSLDQRQLALRSGYPSPKAVNGISSRSQVQTRRMLLEGNPVIVAMRPHERPSR